MKYIGKTSKRNIFGYIEFFHVYETRYSGYYICIYLLSRHEVQYISRKGERLKNHELLNLNFVTAIVFKDW